MIAGLPQYKDHTAIVRGDTNLDDIYLHSATIGSRSNGGEPCSLIKETFELNAVEQIILHHWSQINLRFCFPSLLLRPIRLVFSKILYLGAVLIMFLSYWAVHYPFTCETSCFCSYWWN